jgi:hypothetical protein
MNSCIVTLSSIGKGPQMRQWPEYTTMTGKANTYVKLVRRHAAISIHVPHCMHLSASPYVHLHLYLHPSAFISPFPPIPQIRPPLPSPRIFAGCEVKYRDPIMGYGVLSKV